VYAVRRPHGQVSMSREHESTAAACMQACEGNEG
jgi:hypothetical protein